MNQKRAFVEQDLILVYAHGQPLFFARIEKIDTDVKKGWWRVSMLVLQVPVRQVTWILDEEQIRGADFTMGGIPIKIELVIPPTTNEEPEIPEVNSENDTIAAKEPPEQPAKPDSTQTASGARILSMGPQKE